MILAVRTGLLEAHIDFGVFGPPAKPLNGTPKRKTKFAVPNANGHSDIVEDSEEEEEEEEGEEGEDGEDGEEDGERQSRPVIKLRPARHAGRNLSHSRSRRDLSLAAEDASRPLSPDADSVANVRFSAHLIAKTDLSALLPFALITPEFGRKRARGSRNDATSSPQASEDDHVHERSPLTLPSTNSSRNLPYLQGPPADLKGIFVRKFRWGTVDVLDPNHCDFAALRTAVLSTHLKVCQLWNKMNWYSKQHYSSSKFELRKCYTRSIEPRNFLRGALHVK